MCDSHVISLFLWREGGAGAGAVGDRAPQKRKRMKTKESCWTGSGKGRGCGPETKTDEHGRKFSVRNTLLETAGENKINGKRHSPPEINTINGLHPGKQLTMPVIAPDNCLSCVYVLCVYVRQCLINKAAQNVVQDSELTRGVNKNSQQTNKKNNYLKYPKRDVGIHQRWCHLKKSPTRYVILLSVYISGILNGSRIQKQF